MRRLSVLLLALGAVIGLSSPAHGQGAPFKDSRLNGAAILVRHPGVQAQLKITQEQNDKFREASDRAREKFKADFEKLEQIENGRERSLKKRELSQKVIAEVTKELPKILNAGQMKRLQQICMQQAGIQAFDEKPVRELLRVTPEQLAKINEVRETSAKEYLRIRENLNDNFEVSKKKEHEHKQKTVDKAMALLNPSQREQWKKEVVGEPFDFIATNALVEPTKGEKKPADKKQETAPPAVLKEDLGWVDEAVAKHQPTSDEHKYDQIGWAGGIIEALEMAKKLRRPVIMHTYNDGRIGCGRS